MAIILSTFLRGYRGKTTDFALTSQHHRTIVAHFLNQGKWNDFLFQDALRNSVAYLIYREATISGQPIFCIVDDTIASHTKLSSQALHPIEAAYFSSISSERQTGLWAPDRVRHAFCNGITLNYAVILYDKTKSKIQIIQDIAAELPIAPIVSYFLCDSWYTSAKVMDCFAKKGFYTIGALKTNRILYPCGIRQKASAFALHLRKTDPNISLVTVDKRQFYVYRYEGNLNDVPNTVVLLSYPTPCFGIPKALRIFVSTNAALSTQEILRLYTQRWQIELFFRQSKKKLGLDKYQLRSQKGIQRYWLMMSFVHYMCCTCKGTYIFLHIE